MAQCFSQSTNQVQFSGAKTTSYISFLHLPLFASVCQTHIFLTPPLSLNFSSVYLSSHFSSSSCCHLLCFLYFYHFSLLNSKMFHCSTSNLLISELFRSTSSLINMLFILTQYIFNYYHLGRYLLNRGWSKWADCGRLKKKAWKIELGLKEQHYAGLNLIYQTALNLFILMTGPPCTQK